MSLSSGEKQLTASNYKGIGEVCCAKKINKKKINVAKQLNSGWVEFGKKCFFVKKEMSSEQCSF